MAIAFVVTVLLFILPSAMLRVGAPQAWRGISGLVGLLVAVVGLLVAVVVGWRYTRSLGRIRATAPRQAEGYKTSGPGTKSQAKVPANFLPIPKWKPGVPVDIPRTVAAFLYYFDRKKTLVVFAHGTCVPVSPGCAEPEKEARQALRGVFYSHPDFRTLRMDDGNYMISYSDAAFSVVFRDELDANREYIEEALVLLHRLFPWKWHKYPIETTALIVQVPRQFASITSSNAVSGRVPFRRRSTRLPAGLPYSRGFRCTLGCRAKEPQTQHVGRR
jgi:hypothetical protein